MQRTESQGLVLALAGFALLSFGDAIIKSMAGMWPATAIAMLRYVLGATGLVAILLAREGAMSCKPPRPDIHLWRGLGVAMATCGFFSAVFMMPLAEATAVTFTSPMITALLAALVLGEQLRRATLLATLVAFAGVLIVLRPNFAEIGWPALLPLLSAVGMSVLMLGNRAVAGLASPLAMQAFVATAAASMLVAATLAGHASGFEPLHVAWPHWSVVARCAIVAVTASCAHWLIYLGTTRSGAAVIAPMVYVQLLVAMGLGWIWFGEHPDGVALIGSAIIVGSGVFLWQRSR